MRCGQSAGKVPDMTSLNVKEIPDKVGYYLAGFADGEGSFNLSFRKRKDYSQPWKISLCFNVSQKDKVILTLFKRHLKCGTLRSRSDGVWYYEVNNFTAIQENVIPFFKRFGFLSAKKKRDFAKFMQIASLIEDKQHLEEEGIKRILGIRKTMNDGGAGSVSFPMPKFFGKLIQENPQRLHARHIRIDKPMPSDSY